MLIDIYDQNHAKTGKTKNRGDVLAHNEFQLAACVVIISDDKYLITQRHPKKQMGGFWEFPGGGVEYNEQSIQTAIRELQEEVGLKINKNETEFIATYCYEPFDLLIDIFASFKTIEKINLTLQENEISAVRLVSAKTIKQMIKDELLTPFDSKIAEILQEKFNIK